MVYLGYIMQEPFNSFLNKTNAELSKKCVITQFLIVILISQLTDKRATFCVIAFQLQTLILFR